MLYFIVPATLNQLPTAVTPYRPPICTSTLIETEHQNKVKSRELKKRVAKQQGALSAMARDVHHGGKKDFLLTVAKSLPKFRKQREVPQDDNPKANEDWDGSLDQNDLLFMLKQTESHEHKGVSLYKELIHSHAAAASSIPATELLQLIDSVNTTEAISELRKKLPGYFASHRKVTALKNKYKEEFEAVLLPKRTATGWRIDPDRLRQCLLFRYFVPLCWLKMLRVYGVVIIIIL